MRIQSLHPDYRNILFKSFGAGMLGLGDIHFVLKAGTQTEEYWSSKVPSGFYHNNVENAYKAMQGGQNDVMLITPESHSLDASLTFALNNSHIIGAAAPSMFNTRARIGMSTTFTPMITVSGYGNSFQNLYTMHGTAATDLMGWRITGERNVFTNVHFGGPMNAAQGGHASYEGVSVEGSECYFKDCVFGTDTISRDEKSPNVTLGTGTRTVFENCNFVMNIADTDPLFVYAENTGEIQAWFKNCMFTAFSGNWAATAAVVFDFSSTGACGLYMDLRCCMYNVTDWCVAADDQIGIWLPRVADITDPDTMMSAYRPSIT